MPPSTSPAIAIPRPACFFDNETTPNPIGNALNKSPPAISSALQLPAEPVNDKMKPAIPVTSETTEDQCGELHIPGAFTAAWGAPHCGQAGADS